MSRNITITVHLVDLKQFSIVFTGLDVSYFFVIVSIFSPKYSKPDNTFIEECNTIFALTYNNKSWYS